MNPDQLVAWLDGIIPKEWIVVLLSGSPIMELRGGLLAARLLQIPFGQAFLLSILGNLIPIPFVLLFVCRLITWLKGTRLFRRFGNWLEAKTEQNKEKVLKYSTWGLLLIVALPLPGAGAWTGALVAAVLGMPKRRSLPIIAIGVVLAALIVSLITYGLPALFGYTV